jgi:hypothetical protein
MSRQKQSKELKAYLRSPEFLRSKSMGFVRRWRRECRRRREIASARIETLRTPELQARAFQDLERGLEAYTSDCLGEAERLGLRVRISSKGRLFLKIEEKAKEPCSLPQAVWTIHRPL